MNRQELMKVYPDEVKELATLLLKTNNEQPMKEDVQALGVYLQAHPQLWRVAGDIMDAVAQKLIDRLNAVPSTKESIRSGVASLQQELRIDTDTPLERLIVQQVVLCWLQLAYIENQYTGLMTDGNTTISQASFWERRVNAAQNRFLRASETLARVRRLNMPAVQVNIGQQQVNQVNKG